MPITYRHDLDPLVAGLLAAGAGFGEQHGIKEQQEANQRAQRYQAYGTGLGAAATTGAKTFIDFQRDELQQDHALQRIREAAVQQRQTVLAEERERTERIMQSHGFVKQIPPDAEQEIQTLQNQINQLSRTATSGDITFEAARMGIRTRQEQIANLSQPIWFKPPPKVPTIDEEFEAGDNLRWRPDIGPYGATVSRDVRNGGQHFNVNYASAPKESTTDTKKELEAAKAERDLQKLKADIYADARKDLTVKPDTFGEGGHIPTHAEIVAEANNRMGFAGIQSQGGDGLVAGPVSQPQATAPIAAEQLNAEQAETAIQAAFEQYGDPRTWSPEVKAQMKPAAQVLQAELFRRVPDPSVLKTDPALREEFMRLLAITE